MDRAVFLDRDGVIIQEPPHYAYRPDQLKFIPKAEEAIRLLNKNKFKVVIVSNQAGISRGYYLEKDTILFHQLIKEELGLYGAKIDAIYYCPHHPEAKIIKYRIDCDCRKPKHGMLKKAEKELGIDLRISYMVGDKKSDIDAGNAAGCRTILVLTGHGKDEIKIKDIRCDHIANNLFDAVKYILRFNDREVYI